MDKFISVLFLDAGSNTVTVMIGCFFLGLAAGVVGSLVFLQRRALISDALAHGALPGIGIAFLVSIAFGFDSRRVLALLIGAAGTGLLGVLMVRVLTRHDRVTEDSAIGIVLSVFFGFGVVLLSVIQALDTVSAAGLSHFIYGQAAAMNYSDVHLMVFISLLSTLLVFSFFKEIRLISFDSEFARVQGWPSSRIDFLVLGLTVLVVVAGLQAVGIILVIALLIIPPAAARFWTDRMSYLALLAGGIGAASGYLGSALSASFANVPTGSVVVLTSASLFLVSLFCAPNKGIVAQTVRLFKVRLKVAQDHLLRGVYEVLEEEPEGVMINWLDLGDVPLVNSWSRWFRYVILNRMRRDELIRIDYIDDAAGKRIGQLRLTISGVRAAQAIVEVHRLWERYMIDQFSYTTEQAHKSADFVEHVVTGDLEVKLRYLAERQEES